MDKNSIKNNHQTDSVDRNESLLSDDSQDMIPSKLLYKSRQKLVEFSHSQETSNLSSSDTHYDSSSSSLFEDDDDENDFEDEIFSLKESKKRESVKKSAIHESFSDENSSYDSDYTSKFKATNSSAANDPKRKRSFSKGENKKFAKKGISKRNGNFSKKKIEKWEDYSSSSGDVSDSEDKDEFSDNSYSHDYHENLLPNETTSNEIEGPIIDIVLDHRNLKDAKFRIEPISLLDVEFLVKLKGKSYLHSTWYTYTFIMQNSIRGSKKVENYVKNFNYIPFKELSSEDLEQLYIDAEMSREAIMRYKKIDRIISMKEDSNEYLVKWKSLGYDCCTWESSTIVASLSLQAIDKFLGRESNLKIPSKGKFPHSTKARGTFHKLISQPSYLNCGGTLRDYQLDGLNWLAYSWSRNNNVILADEMGLGKTIQSTSLLSWLFHEQSIYGPFLIVVPLSTLGAWQMEIEKWAPDMNLVVYSGNNLARQTISNFEFYTNSTSKNSYSRNAADKGRSSTAIKFNILLTTFEFILKDKLLFGSIKWAILVVDEAHKLKNVNSMIHDALNEFHATNRLLITGTPLQNSVKELWCLMNFLMPKKFDSWADFEMQYSAISQESQVRKLHEQLRPHILRRMKRDVEKSLPSKNERILRVELSPIQQRLYRLILTKNYKELNKGSHGKQTSLINIMNELKKASSHAFLFDFAQQEIDPHKSRLDALIEGSGKMVLLDRLLTRLKETDHRVLIFSQMVKILDLIEEYLILKKYIFQRLDGSTDNESRKQSIEHFNAINSTDFCFLLSTRAGGLGINLETADTVVIFDSDWNPQNDLQAMARAHRIGQKNVVNIYRFISKGTVEEEILERAKQKMVLDHVIIQKLEQSQFNGSKRGTALKTNHSSFSKEELQSILQFGAQNLFSKSVDDASTTPVLPSAFNLDEILERAEAHDTSSSVNNHNYSVSGNEEFLSQFKMADLGSLLDWNEIIPKEEIEKIETEELLQKELLLYESHIERQKKKDAALSAIQQNFGRQKEKLTNNKSRSNKNIKKEDKTSCTNMENQSPNSEESIEFNTNGFNTKQIRLIIKIFLRFGTKNYQKFKDELLSFNTSNNDSCKEFSSPLTDAAIEMEKSKFTALTDELVQIAQKNSDKNNVKLQGKITLNCSFFFKRISYLDLLYSLMHQYEINENSSVYSYRITSKLKPPTKWSIDWGPKDDSHLIIGTYLYGFGEWNAIIGDTKLHLDAIKLDQEGFIPKGEHLLRRVEYLFMVLFSSPTATSIDNSLKGHSLVKPLSHDDDHQLSKQKKGKKQKKIEDFSIPIITAVNNNDSNLLVSKSSSLKELMKPVKGWLQKLESLDEPDVSVICECMINIGQHIKQQPFNLSHQLWEFVTLCWPSEGTTGDDLEKLHEKILIENKD